MDLEWKYGIVLGTCSGIVLPPEDAEIWDQPPSRMREILDEAREMWPYVVDIELLASCPQHYQDGPDQYLARMILAAGRAGSNPLASPSEKEIARLIMQDNAGYVYTLKGGSYYKIGCSKDVNRRIVKMSPKLPFDVTLVSVIATNDRYGLERKLHGRFAEKRTNGEWFELDEDDVEYIRGLAR